MHRVFVYGTLKRNCRNAHFLESADFIGATATANATWNMMDVVSLQSPGNTYPAVTKNGIHKISGEIYEVDDDTLIALDRLENVGSRYTRELVDFDDGSRAFMYINIDPDLVSLPSSANIVQTGDQILEWKDNEDPRSLIMLDGGMGQELYRRGIRPDDPDKDLLWSANALETHFETVVDIHLEFIKAGAKVITTNTYCTNPDRLRRASCPGAFDRLNDLACQAALVARAKSGLQHLLIAGSLSPLYGSYRPDLDQPVDVMQAEYAQMVEKLTPHVDLFLCETMASSAEALAAGTAAVESGLPLWIAFTLDDASPVLRSGESLEEAISDISHLTPQAILFNCCSPEVIGPALKQARHFTDAALGAYANGFKPIPENWRVDIEKLGVRQDLGPEDYLAFVKDWIEKDAKIIGGCCEIGPAHIQTLSDYLQRVRGRT